MVQGCKRTVTKIVTQAMLANTNRRLDVGSLMITDCNVTESNGVIRMYDRTYSCIVRFQKQRNGYFVTINNQEDYLSLFANNDLTLGSSIEFQGFYNRNQRIVYITARKVEDGEVVYLPNELEPTAPVVPGNNMALPPAPSPGTAAPAKAVRARRFPARKNGAVNASRRISARLASKQRVAAFSFEAPSEDVPSDSSTTSVDEETAAILDGLDQEVTSAEFFKALAQQSAGAAALQAAAVATNVLESLSPARGESSGVAHEDEIMEEAICAPQSTMETFFSAKSSILGKRKADDRGEVDSLRDAAATAGLSVEELEIKAQDFNAALDSAKAMLKKLVADRLAEEEQQAKKRKVNGSAPTALTVPTGLADCTAPACSPPLSPADKGTKGAKKGPAKKHGVARKVATKKAAAGGAGGNVRKTAAKQRGDPCLPVGMKIVKPSGDVVYGSIATEDNIRKSGRIQARRPAAQAMAKTTYRVPSNANAFETSTNRRRKQAMPALAAVW